LTWTIFGCHCKPLNGSVLARRMEDVEMGVGSRACSVNLTDFAKYPTKISAPVVKQATGYWWPEFGCLPLKAECKARGNSI
jgi:hypothetical protein